LSNTSTGHYGEMTELLLKHKDYPGSNNGTGLFQVLVGLKMRETYEKLTAKTAQTTAKV
ncbi:MAG: phosphoribulokinase, partial [Waterburya sp.]